jgi:phosphoglycerate dehydrogenase-like enzyme
MHDRSSNPLRLAITADFFDADGDLKYRDTGLGVLDAEPNLVEYERIGTFSSPIQPDQVADFDAVLVLTPAVAASSLARADRLLAIVRFGVGYDAVDVAACTASDVAVIITPGAVDRSVAEATISWMLALAHQTRIKDALVRSGRWDDRARYMGSELRDRVLGLVGFGGIARATKDLAHGFSMRKPVVYDPFVNDDVIRQHGCEPVSLDELLSVSDFVSIHCPLTNGTRGLIGKRELALMKPSAYLINTARGGIVDEPALCDALRSGAIAGAAIDCFEVEPVRTPHPLSEFDNVLLAPHSIAWSNELFRDIGTMACQSVLDLARGRRPHGLVNPEVLEQPGFLRKWKREPSPCQ